MHPQQDAVYDSRFPAIAGEPLVLEGITKRWASSDTPVLCDIDLTVDPGTAIQIVGPNGSGKTTLLRIAAGVIKPETGRVRLGGIDVESDRAAYHQRIGYLSALSAGLYARLTVRDHVSLWARLALLPRSCRESACARMLDAFALRSLEDRRVDRLSMGQRQRVRLAGAFIHDPDVVLLDEPGNSLDDRGLELLHLEVDRLRGRGGATVWCAPTCDASGVDFDRRMTIASARLVDS